MSEQFRVEGYVCADPSGCHGTACKTRGVVR